jgi:hypothetical protein
MTLTHGQNNNGSIPIAQVVVSGTLQKELHGKRVCINTRRSKDLRQHPKLSQIKRNLHIPSSLLDRLWNWL